MTQGIFGRKVLQALAKHPEGMFAGQLIRDLEITGSTSPVYLTLKRLERKGWVTSRWVAAVSMRGGRRKQRFRITAAGMAATVLETTEEAA